MENKTSKYGKTQGIRAQAKAWQQLLQCRSQAKPAKDNDNAGPELELEMELSLVVEEGFDPYNNISVGDGRR